MSDLFDINKVDFSKKFIKPEFKPIDFDISNYKISLETNIKEFKFVITNDLNNIIEYANSNYIRYNYLHQTPLMLACELNNLEAVKLLLNEVGQIDRTGKSSLDYAINGSEVYNLIKIYENYKKND